MYTNPLQAIASALGLLPPGNLNFHPFDMEKYVVLVGKPPVQMAGLDSISSRRHHPEVKFLPSLGGGGRTLSNRNISGEIRLRFLASSWSLGHIEVFSAFGAPVPILITDLGSGGTRTVIGEKCKVLDSGEWRGEGVAPMVEVVYNATKLWKFHGVRLIHL